MPETDINRFIDEQRPECLWFVRKDYYPDTKKQKIYILRQIQKNGNLDAFKKAGEIICRLQNSKN